MGSGLRRNTLHDRGRHLFENLDIGPLGVGERPALLYGAGIRAGPGRLSDIEGVYHQHARERSEHNEVATIHGILRPTNAVAGGWFPTSSGIGETRYRRCSRSVLGTFETCRRALRMSVYLGRPEVVG